MFSGYKRRNRPKIEQALVDIIINRKQIPAPLELIEHYYRKEYGLTFQEFMNEPVDRLSWFLKIRELEAKRDEIDMKKARR
mgnify:CR=1 FL=1